MQRAGDHRRHHERDTPLHHGRRADCCTRLDPVSAHQLQRRQGHIRLVDRAGVGPCGGQPASQPADEPSIAPRFLAPGYSQTGLDGISDAAAKFVGTLAKPE